jgi:murein DD-endopeptidase MepM/ murein hydrolase activator NlpD
MRTRLFLLAVLAALAAATPALGTGPAQKKARVDARRAQLQNRIEAERQRESALAALVHSSDAQIASLERQVGDVSARLAPLERDLELHRRRLAALNELFRIQTRRLHALEREHALAVHRLSLRMVEIYESSPPGALDAVFVSSNLADLISQVEFTRAIALQDRQILRAVTRSRHAAHAQRRSTKRTRRQVAAATREVAGRTAEVERMRARLLAQQGSLVSARNQKQQSKEALSQSISSMVEESSQLALVSSELEAKIQASQSGGGGSGTSSSGLIWPVSGPITSPYGYRCFQGRCELHPGIDIGVPAGTPIHAAAAGKIIWAGWLGGYGNLTVIDHGRGMATAYGHQSSIGVAVGQRVSQGQYIGNVGCTGYCFGDHLHFEVRINGSPVNPVGYLP